jgi:hypothetical protein
MLRKPVPSPNQLAGQSVIALAPKQYVYCCACHCCLTPGRNAHFVPILTSNLDNRTPALSDCGRTQPHSHDPTCRKDEIQEYIIYKRRVYRKEDDHGNHCVKSCMHCPLTPPSTCQHPTPAGPTYDTVKADARYCDAFISEKHHFFTPCSDACVKLKVYAIILFHKVGRSTFNTGWWSTEPIVNDIKLTRCSKRLMAIGCISFGRTYQ